MTATCTLTYDGPLASGSVALPDRTVRFTRGEPVEFTVDEAVLLDPQDWTGPAGAPSSTPPDGPPDGTVAEVLAWVDDDPDRAGRALEVETAGKARTSLITQLTELSTSATGAHTEEG